MPPELPADTEAELRREFLLGIDALRDGRTMTIGGLCLYRDTREHRFIVHCYSSCYYAENVTQSEAEERIATAKTELNTLLRMFPELRDQLHGLDLAFHFCYDADKSAFLVAKEEHGQFQYLANVA
jgi:hypothetical protein